MFCIEYLIRQLARLVMPFRGSIVIRPANLEAHFEDVAAEGELVPMDPLDGRPIVEQFLIDLRHEPVRLRRRQFISVYQIKMCASVLIIGLFMFAVATGALFIIASFLYLVFAGLINGF